MFWLLDNGHIMEQRPSPKKSNYTGSISDDTLAFLAVIWMGCSFFCTDKHFSLLNFFELSVLRVSAQKKRLNNCTLLHDQGCFTESCSLQMSWCFDQEAELLMMAKLSFRHECYIAIYVCTYLHRYNLAFWKYLDLDGVLSYLLTFCFVHLPKCSSASWMK